jgi:hypothetical protein
MAIVNEVLPNAGNYKTPAQYRNKAKELGYNFYQQIGSIGGAVKSKSVRYDSHGNIIRN